jgi:hypothetical protein
VAASRQEGRGSVIAGTQLPSSARRVFTAAIVKRARVIGPHPGRVIPGVFVLVDLASAPRPAQGAVC